MFMFFIKSSHQFNTGKTHSSIYHLKIREKILRIHVDCKQLVVPVALAPNATFELLLGVFGVVWVWFFVGFFIEFWLGFKNDY